MERGIGISGTGRIGRLLIRKLMSKEENQTSLKAINSIYPADTIAHLLKYDSVHGKWDADISAYRDGLRINGNDIKMTFEREPSEIPWRKFGIDLVVDATGKFNDRHGASGHIEAGAKKVIITAPGKQMDLTIVMGVNEQLYDPEEQTYLSAASCTTNCVAPILKVLDDSFQVKQGWLTTIHSFTSDQKPLDNPHNDLRRARACTQSIVPTTTGIGAALKDVLPHLSPVIRGTSVRVPTQDVSLADLTIQVDKHCEVDEVITSFRNAARGELAEFIDITDEPLVSIDYVGCTKSAVVDGPSIMTFGDQIKLLAWYDNEWAYVCRVAELSNYVKERMVDYVKV
ncbi:type I glyceraldehyde-3-phosphate dehydrogenase [Aquibacillus saliphilus]|uniref:type I glyceraldehyde-3-phosphate dehydrogenase n=1 Tax=Aquibacillus saliphilus TaxID=1909422 RepID=UPI001CF0747D|nr:type I glyceraldehyde-3-phosphate dehydrogenase [Aquibacillus saliphilus]